MKGYNGTVFSYGQTGSGTLLTSPCCSILLPSESRIGRTSYRKDLHDDGS